MACEKLLTFLFIVFCLVTSIKTDYIAAVVEYQHANLSTPNETVEYNLDQYILHIQDAKAKSVQIIVFPEYGLTGLVQDPENYSIEIPNPPENKFSNYWLEKLSNAAVAQSMYIVVNLLEKDKNANNKTVHFNTDVVFSPSGSIVAKYRKINLFGEPALTPGDPTQNQNTFTTDFGVTFGVFTCYDIGFYNPARSILLNTSVTDIVFPTAWISYLPFFHSLSTQYAYATANKVNLLSANLNAIQNGRGGSSIYGANGTVFSEYIPKGTGTKLNVATVRNGSNKTINMLGGFDSLDDDVPTLSSYVGERHFESEKYAFKRLNISQVIIEEQVCHKSYCCVFNVNMSSTALNSSDVFQIMAYRGPLKLPGVKSRNVKICALVTCESSDPSTCATRNVTVYSKINSVSVKNDMTDVQGEFYVPTSLTRDLEPVHNVIFDSTATGGVRKTVLKASDITQPNVLVFGIMGNKGVTLSFNSILFVGVLIINYVFH